MLQLAFDPQICEDCQTCDCLVRCQYLDYTLEAAKIEKMKIIRGEDTPVISECLTCYACEEYCPHSNHPFYQIVQRQEEKGFLPAPAPIFKQQTIMMGPKNKLKTESLKAPLINMCAFPMLTGSIKGKLYEGASTISGTDIFCNIMWLHFAKNSLIAERLPAIVETLEKKVMAPSGIDEMICYHDECYGAYTHTAPAFGIDIPFKTVHLFEYLNRRLDALKDQIKPLNAKVAYQRPCSNRLIPETDPLLDQIFEKIGVERVNREYDRHNALCCGGILRAHQRDILADDLQKRNIDDMQSSGAVYTVFNCPFCMITLGEAVLEKGLFPILVSDLCQAALKP